MHMVSGKKVVMSSQKRKQNTRMEEIEKDPRFAHTAKDPRFKPNFKHKKVKIDSRFKSMLQDKEFNIKFLDKRGRPINSSTKEDLRRLYEYESEEEKDSSEEEKSEEDESDREESCGEEEEQDDNDDAESSKTEGEASEEHEEENEKAEEHTDDSKLEADYSDDDFPDLTEEGAPDYARGVGVLESSSDEDQEGEGEDDGEEEEGILDHNWNEPDRNAPEAEETTSRLALCNMDWDRIKARDLYVLFTSFLPQGGAVQSVTIYPSQLGLEKMAEEEKLGPREFREGDEKKEGKEEGRVGKLDHAKLRRYQLNRLAYYYAVIVCDSKETANKLYEECDSMEYEKSACRIDLRFIPEGMTFEETPKDTCAGVSDLSTFQPSTFTTTAFCQAKVQVTWDETNIERLSKTMQKKFTEEDLGSSKFDELIALSSSEDSSEEEADSKRPKKKTKTKQKKDVKKYRKLLGLEEDKPETKEDEDSLSSGGESEQEEDEEMLFSPLLGSGSEDDDEGAQFSPSVDGKSDDEEEEQRLGTVKTKKETKKRKDKKKKPKRDGDHPNLDTSEDEEEVEGEMEYTWQPSAHQKMLTTQAKKNLTPWEEYQQKKKDKKKEKKREQKRQRLREQGIEDTTDLGFDDAFFNDEPSEETTMKKKKKERKKKRRQEEKVEESETDKKERASLALLMKDDDHHHNHFSLLQIMKEESEGKKKKGKKRKQSEVEALDSFEMKLDHSRFGSLYTDPNMHIDPNAPEFKKTKGMVTLIEEVSKKRKTVHNAL